MAEVICEMRAAERARASVMSETVISLKSLA